MFLNQLLFKRLKVRIFLNQLGKWLHCITSIHTCTQHTTTSTIIIIIHKTTSNQHESLKVVATTMAVQNFKIKCNRYPWIFYHLPKVYMWIEWSNRWNGCIMWCQKEWLCILHNLGWAYYNYVLLCWLACHGVCECIISHSFILFSSLSSHTHTHSLNKTRQFQFELYITCWIKFVVESFKKETGHGIECFEADNSDSIWTINGIGNIEFEW